ncbi:MAG: hypothetical protein HOA75_18465 [Deltaproteobacteria bacterium]|nr:hypothetical protein [Deltaproteobacteria bacterium]
MFEPADHPGVVNPHSPLLKQERAPHFLDPVAKLSGIKLLLEPLVIQAL